MSLVDIVVLSSALLSVAPRWRRWPNVLPLIAVAAAIVVVLAGGPVARAVATVVGIPSIASIVLIADIALKRAFNQPILTNRGRRAILWFMAISALFLYPSSLGFFTWDVYRPGFSAAAPAVIAAAGIWLMRKGETALAFVSLIVLVAIDVQLYPSVNAFDYLIDPIGGLVALCWAAGQLWSAVWRRVGHVEAPIPVQESAD